MKRPTIVHFLGIITNDFINIRASISLKENPLYLTKDKDKIGPANPIQNFKLLRSDEFTIKLVGLDSAHQEVYKKNFDSDLFGNFNFKIPLTDERRKIEVLQVYEVKNSPGLELLLGTFIPLKITTPKNLVISDFDKTLVDTRYHTTKEVYYSLTKSIDNFPTVPASVEIIKGFIKEGYHPFILSASPHFYEDAMRDWLYQNQIYTAGIFLKDYRHIFSLFEWDLTPKDLKIHGLYKLNHLLDMLLMSGIPDNLVLMGDNFESDPAIYMALSKMLREDMDPWLIWKSLIKHDAFASNKKQDSQILNKIYQLQNLVNRRDQEGLNRSNIKIFIRRKGEETEVNLPEGFKTQSHLIQLYEGHPDKESKEPQKLEGPPA